MNNPTASPAVQELARFTRSYSEGAAEGLEIDRKDLEAQAKAEAKLIMAGVMERSPKTLESLPVAVVALLLAAVSLIQAIEVSLPKILGEEIEP